MPDELGSGGMPTDSVPPRIEAPPEDPTKRDDCGVGTAVFPVTRGGIRGGIMAAAGAPGGHILWLFSTGEVKALPCAAGADMPGA
jgi:hypothetical protein